MFIQFEPKTLVFCVYSALCLWLSSSCGWPSLKYFGCRTMNKIFFLHHLQHTNGCFFIFERRSRIPAQSTKLCVFCCSVLWKCNNLLFFVAVVFIALARTLRTNVVFKYFVVSYVNVVAVVILSDRLLSTFFFLSSLHHS